MMSKIFTSQKGFSLIKILAGIVVLALAILYFLPTIGGTPFDIVNQLSGKAKSVVDQIGAKVSTLGRNLSENWDSYKTRGIRFIQDLLDKWNLNKLSEMISGVETQWQEDMNTLVGVSKSRGFDMESIERRQDEYVAGQTSWKRVETEYWEEVRTQTRESIIKSIEQFRTMPLGCSDFTDELRTIWDIGQEFNKDTFEGYDKAKQLSAKLQSPRSEDFLQEILHWLHYQEGQKFVRHVHRAVTHFIITDASLKNLELEGVPAEVLAQLQQIKGQEYPSKALLRSALVTTLGQAGADEYQQLIVAYSKPDYPSVISQIDTQSRTSRHPYERILSDLTVAEIYLNYDLINPAEDRFDEAIRNLSAVVSHYARNRYDNVALGLHMALGLLHERVCKNTDLAIKEFKDVVAIAKRLGLRCEDYSMVHYHLGIINLNLRADKDVSPEFEATSSSYNVPTKVILSATPTPTPTPSPTPTPQPIKITLEIPRSRELTEESRPERPAEGTGTPVPATAATTPVPVSPTYTGVVKGTIQPGDIRRPERDIRLRPRAELGDSLKMKKFNIDALYDLNKIPDDAAREFELYLKCVSHGDRADIARFIHQKYLGK